MRKPNKGTVESLLVRIVAYKSLLRGTSSSRSISKGNYSLISIVRKRILVYCFPIIEFSWLTKCAPCLRQRDLGMSFGRFSAQSKGPSLRKSLEKRGEARSISPISIFLHDVDLWLDCFETFAYKQIY